MKNKVKKNLLLMAAIYLACEAGKDFEFLVLKTDQTFLGENIFCKLFTIGIIVLSLRKLHFSWNDIGFKKSGIIQGAVFGFSLGGITFFASYMVEALLLRKMGLHPEFSFYIANFTISRQNVTGVGLSALAICVLGNIVNVVAEEGLFRGLLLRIGSSTFTRKAANFIQAALFGVWHLITVVVWILDGTIDIPAALVMSLGYMILAGILGYEWGLCAALTGTLWVGCFEHFWLCHRI